MNNQKKTISHQKLFLLKIFKYYYIFFCISLSLSLSSCYTSINNGDLKSTTINAPAGSIQAAINSASSGDTVIIKDGIYKGIGNRNLNFQGKAITLKSENGAAKCIIDCQGVSRGFVFRNNEGKDSVIDGFTIKNGIGARLGRDWAGGNPTVGGAIFCDGAAPTIKNNIFLQNSAELGGAICYFKSSNIVVRNNRFVGNKAVQSHGGGLYLNKCKKGIIERNIFRRNNAAFAGGAICTQEESSPLIQYNIIKNNIADSGGGVSISNGNLTISNNLIIGNKSIGIQTGPNFFAGGGAMSLWGAEILAINNSFISNSAKVRGGAIEAAYTNVVFEDNIFSNNTAKNGNNIYLAYYQSGMKRNSSMKIKNSLLQGGKASCVVEKGCVLRGENFSVPVFPVVTARVSVMPNAARQPQEGTSQRDNEKGGGKRNDINE